ncbi:MAG: endonuclease I [Planctomycetota bacterium]
MKRLRIYGGNITGSKKDANDYSFKPRDEVKGDVSRMLFYRSVRYEGLDSYPDLELTEVMLTQSNTEPIHGVNLPHRQAFIYCVSLQICKGITI